MGACISFFSSSSPSKTGLHSHATTNNHSNGTEFSSTTGATTNSSVGQQSQFSDISTGIISDSGKLLESPNLKVYNFLDLKTATKNFKPDSMLGQVKSVTYMRLDGSVVPEKRFEIVKAFNSDPTIDVLLLTTHVGGLGLNLTSADTLVFMEHDWNPMRDHQAMDRAHRLGQKRVVNVHRLIMRGTLEEKVMSLQKFKVSVANTVINAENASMKTMNTDQLLDLFASAETSKKGGGSSKKGSEDNDQIAGTGKGMKAIQ